MHISFNTEDLTPQDLAVLRLIAGETSLPAESHTHVVIPSAGETEPSPARKVKPAPAKKAEPEPEPDVDPETVTAAEFFGDNEVTLQQVVDAATALVSNGKSGAVRVALKEVGAPKVTEIKDAATRAKWLALVQDDLDALTIGG